MFCDHWSEKCTLWRTLRQANIFWRRKVSIFYIWNHLTWAKTVRKRKSVTIEKVCISQQFVKIKVNKENLKTKQVILTIKMRQSTLEKVWFNLKKGNAFWYTLRVRTYAIALTSDIEKVKQVFKKRTKIFLGFYGSIIFFRASLKLHAKGLRESFLALHACHFC